MRVLLLSPLPELIEAPIRQAGDDLRISNDAPAAVDFSADLVVSFGYRYILKEPILSALPIINIHVSYLPWNRGADPNFWSWFDATPKGVSIHHIDAGIDTGDILAQQEVAFSDHETLATSYGKLRAAGVALFAASWPLIRAGQLPRQPQRQGGSAHRLKDKEPWWSRLPSGYDTPVSLIAEIGAEEAASRAFRAKYHAEIAAARAGKPA
jgi:methionyl-tRNA formyltransferase